MANDPEAEYKGAQEKSKPELGEVPFEDLTTNDKIQKLIDDNLDAVNIADLRSEWGRRELASILGKAEKIGHQRGFAEGIIEEQVQNTCEDIVGNMLAKVDDGKKKGVTFVSLVQAVEEQDVTITHEAIIRAREIFNNNGLLAQANIYASQNEQGDTLFSMRFIIDVQSDQPKPAEKPTPEE